MFPRRMTVRAPDLAPDRPSPGLGAAALALIELTKPRITRMVLVTTLLGAVAAPGRPPLGSLAIALLATGAVVAAANVLNMVLERDVDARMARTAKRPIPSGRVSAELALWFGCALAFAGITTLIVAVNPTAGLLAAVALLSYVVVYTPLKRVTPFALQAGALPGAIPPLIGWASATGELTSAALSLFAILFFWQIPHFLAISIVRRREYECAGLAVYAAARGLRATQRALFGYSVLLVVVSFAPLLLGLGGVGHGVMGYAVIAATLGAVQIALAAIALGEHAERWARRSFFASLPYPIALLGWLALVAP
jgi:heme o synthase